MINTDSIHLIQKDSDSVEHFHCQNGKGEAILVYSSFHFMARSGMGKSIAEGSMTLWNIDDGDITGLRETELVKTTLLLPHPHNIYFHQQKHFNLNTTLPVAAAHRMNNWIQLNG